MKQRADIANIVAMQVANDIGPASADDSLGDIAQNQVQGAALLDLRFRALLPRADWDALPLRVQQRFSKRLAGDRVALYAGRIEEARFSKIGWFLAQALRLIGAPLPLSRDAGVPAAVCVAEDPQGGGQLWTRIYHHRRGFPQMINSAKRFAGPSGLEEYIGKGIGMALRVRAVEGGLAFESDHYFLKLGRIRIRIPHFCGPGRTEVRHIDKGEGRFDFSLILVHPLLGELVYQRAEFCDQ
ncbi:DUF4166 domain-containing protein [Sphingorhabdus arenilitoris]|uniref:DUF4166 domain-containing protein n=1 Tax=Sphingorhabdus arenilitoris TaxID=1490041 RepID=A0ABV8RCB2_9SPHN